MKKTGISALITAQIEFVHKMDVLTKQEQLIFVKSFSSVFVTIQQKANLFSNDIMERYTTSFVLLPNLLLLCETI